MMFNLLLVFTIVSVALVGSHAVTPEEYWKSVLPNSPMPKAVKELLDPEIVRDFDRYTTSKDQLKDHPEKLYTYSSSKDQLKDHPEKLYAYSASKDQLKDHPEKLYAYSASKDQLKDHPEKLYTYSASKDQLKDHPEKLYAYSASKDQLKDHPEKLYAYSASKDQLKDDPNAALLFLESDLYQGKEIMMHLTKKDQKALLLPKKIADSIPFSSKNLTQVYNMFSVKPDSGEAEIMKRTLTLCEHKGNDGEEKYCATSLESMIDFSTTKLGKKVKAISTEVNTKESTTFSKYKIEGAKKLATNKAVICHKQNYAYAVFYCHTTVAIKAYAVSLLGENDTKVNALAVCHTDTSKWNPQHLAFQVLKVKPGGVPVCHFLPEDHVVWVPLQTTN